MVSLLRASVSSRVGRGTVGLLHSSRHLGATWCTGGVTPGINYNKILALVGRVNYRQAQRHSTVATHDKKESVQETKDDEHPTTESIEFSSGILELFAVSHDPRRDQEGKPRAGEDCCNVEPERVSNVRHSSDLHPDRA